MANVATAYVKILPTTKDFMPALKRDVTPAAQSVGKDAGAKSGKSFGDGFKNMARNGLNAAGDALKKLAKVGAAATAAAGAAATKVIKDSIAAGGALEQSIGGIEALYGSGSKAAQTLIANADKAWQTAGMSANTYMETVTSFSASLLNSVGGDSERAAELADQAIRDMGDNVNRFGTDMDSVQNAIMGLAKGNYAMLDNLKLGFGGSQQGMIDLINSSGVLEEKITSLDNVGFDTMLEAIHKVQENLHVTGTTAAEAATTLEGSASAMKAAWQNALAALSTGHNVETAFDDLGTALQSYLSNLGPMIQRAASGLPSMLSGMWSALTKGFDVKQFADSMSAKIKQLPGIVSTIAEKMKEDSGNGEFMSAMAQIVSSLGQAALQTLPSLGSMIITGLHSIGTFLSSLDITGLIGQIPDLIGKFADWLSEKANSGGGDASGFGKAAMDIVIALGKALVQSLPALGDAIIAGQSIIINAMGTFLEGVIASIGNFFAPMAEKGAELMAKAGEGIRSKWDTVKTAAAQSVSQAVAGINGKIDTLRTKGAEFIDRIRNGISMRIATLANVAGNVVATVRNGFSNVLGSLSSIGWDIVRGIWSGISSAGSWLWQQITSWAHGFVNTIKSVFKIGSPSKLLADEVGHWLPPGVMIGVEANMEPLDKATDAMKERIVGNLQGMNATVNATTTVPVYTKTDDEDLRPIEVNIYASEGQSVNDLYNVFERRLTNSVLRKGAAFA